MSRLRLIFFALTTLLLTPLLRAKDISLKVSPVTLSFQAQEGFVPENFRDRLGDDWEAFCQRFGQNLIVGKGPQGRGVANKINCLDINFVTSVKDISPTEDAWNFIFGWESSGLSLLLYYTPRGQKGESILVSKIEFPKQFTPDLLFNTNEASYYVLNRIYRRLPAAWSAVFKKTDLQWQLRPLDPQSLSLMAPAEKVGLYALRYSPEHRAWIPKLYAIAQTVSSEDNRKPIDRQGRDALELRWIATPPRDKIRLWAQEILSPLEREVEPSFVTMQKEEKSETLLEGYAIDGLKSDQVMMRYAMAFPKGSTVVSQASKIELVGTVGKGLLEGFIFSYQYSPRHEQAEATETYSYSWSRMEAGWSFNLGTPYTIDRFATQFKLTPKIGLMSIDAYFPLNANENLEFSAIASFEVKNQLELGGELSWQLESLNYRLKVWGTAHIAGYVLAGATPTKISSQRAGGDIYYDLWKTRGGMRFAMVGFGFIEWLNVQQDSTSQESTDEVGLNLAASTTATGASYSVTYIGAGLSITW